MQRTKVDYGIDLGTTNSAICRMEAAGPTIKKTGDQMDTMPSCVQVKRKGRKMVGSSAYNAIKQGAVDRLNGRKDHAGDVFTEFKRNMGTDHAFHSTVEGRDFSPEELSSEILSALTSYCTDESKIDAAVITVPAMFTEPQRNATQKAANLAGIKQCTLLQEPIAAAMAYGLKQGGAGDGIWMVFDFGGGTFDAALVRSSEGVLEVFDTEGNNHLGGKNIDEAIVTRLLLPRLREEYEIEGLLADDAKAYDLRVALKAVAEDCKKELSRKSSISLEDLLDDPLGVDDNGEEIELLWTITLEEFRPVCTPIYQEAVDCCVRLLKRNHLDGEKISKLILVGGPTLSPIVPEMLREQVSPNVDSGVIDPMTAVATGAALFASTLDRKTGTVSEVTAETVKLDVQYEATTVQEMEFVTIKPEANAPDGELWIELEAGDGSWSSGKIQIGEQGELVEVPLKEGKANSFTLKLQDGMNNRIPCFPEGITILQGVMVKQPPLAYSIGIETWDENRKKGLFTPLTGLERNKPIPATGTRSGLKLPARLRPGNPEDVLRIPVYEGKDGRDGKLAKLSEPVNEIRISGPDVPETIPAGDEVDLTLKVNESGLWHMEIYFPSIDWTFEKDFDLHKMSEAEISATVDSMVREAERSLHTLEGHTDTKGFMERLGKIKQGRLENVQSEKSLGDVKDLLAQLEDLEDISEWDICEKQFEDLVADFSKCKSSLSSEAQGTLDGLKSEFLSLRETNDARAARGVLDDLSTLYFQVNMRQLVIAFLVYMEQSFAEKRWRDRNRARSLLDTSFRQIQQNAPTDALRAIAAELISLLPEEEQQEAGRNGLLIR